MVGSPRPLHWRTHRPSFRLDLTCPASETLGTSSSILADHFEIGDILRGFWCWNEASAIAVTCHFSMTLAFVGVANLSVFCGIVAEGWEVLRIDEEVLDVDVVFETLSVRLATFRSVQVGNLSQTHPEIFDD